MPDIFDQIAEQPQGDIFDQVAAQPQASTQAPQASPYAQFMPDLPTPADERAMVEQFGREHPIATNAITGIGETIGGMIPRDPYQYLQMLYPPLATVEATRQAIRQQSPQPIISQVPLVGRIPEIQAAEETPAWSKERFGTAARTLMDVGLLGFGAKVPRAADIVAREVRPTYYRGGGPSSPPRGKTAADIIQYEQQELGNNIIPERGVDLSSIPSEKTQWVSPTEVAASQFGATEPIQGNFRILARDPDGGLLVERQEYASTKPSTEGVPQYEVRPRVGEEAPLRQSGETAPAQEPAAAPVAPNVPEQAQAPVEAPPAETPRVTSTKNAVVDQERVARGLSPIASRVAQSNPETWSLADQKLTENPSYGKALVDDLVTGKRQEISEVDEAVLLREKIATQNAREDAAARALNPKLSDSEKEFARQEYDTLEAQMGNIDAATKRTGETWGKLGQFRQQLAADDYSLVAVERRMRMAQEGKPLTPEQNAQLKAKVAELDALDRRIQQRNARLEQAIAQRKGFAPPRQKPRTVEGDVETEALQTELNRLLAQEREVGRLPAAKERAAKRIAELEQRLSEYGYAEPTKRTPIEADQELSDLQFKYATVKQELDRGVFMNRLKHQSTLKKIGRYLGEAWNLPRALMASADISAFRRQGGLFMLGNPLKASRALKETFGAVSRRGYFETMKEIRSRPNAAEYQQYLDMTDVEPATGLAKMEEMYQSRLAEKIPVVSHSQRIYVAYLNRIRADLYDSLKASLGRDGKITPEQGRVLGNFVNVWTGRGALPRSYVNATVALNHAFFAARWRLSRFQALLGQPLWYRAGSGAGLKVRALIAREYAKTLIGYGIVFGTIGAVTKEAIETDPRSADFGKIKIGNTRIDLLSGIQQPTVLLSRLTTGVTKGIGGEEHAIRGQVKYGKSDAADLASRYVRMSLAPVPGKILDILSGRDVIGKPVTPLNTATSLMLPLSGQDIYDAMKEQGVPAGSALGLLAIFGDGLQTYEPRTPKAPRLLRRPPSPAQMMRRKRPTP